MLENVDGYEIKWTEDQVFLKFVDIFGEGEVYVFGKGDAVRIRDALDTAIEGMK